MNALIRKKLEAVLSYPLFQSVGEPLRDSVTPVGTWEFAIKESNSKRWENCRLMARNTLQRFTEERNWSRAHEWNAITDELRPKIVSFVETFVANGPAPREILEKIKSDVSWDVMFICLEHQYRDVVDPFFYVPLLDPWYAAGHFPCGWDGEEFPDRWDGVIRDGRLMVF
jgi:hypothetical protein